MCYVEGITDADYGVESSLSLEGKSSKDVEAALRQLMQAEPVPK